MPTEKPRPERPADLGKKARNDLLYLARTERSMGNDLLASRIEEAVESLDAFRSFAIHQAEQIADLKERLDRKMARLRQADEVIAGLEDERVSVECVGGDCRPEWNWRRTDCPVHGDEAQARDQLDAAIAIARTEMVEARTKSEAAAERYNDLVRRKVEQDRA